MHACAELFYEIHEPYAAGLFEHPEQSLFERYARAQRRFWEHCSLDDYHGGWLYPCGIKCTDDYAVRPDYSYTLSVNLPRLNNKDERAVRWMAALPSPTPLPDLHTVGGAGYTHAIVHYERVLAEGLDAYQGRVERMSDPCLRDGLRDLLVGIRAYHARAVARLRESNARPELLSALERVPFAPCRTLYEALVCWNFLYYLDFCDNLGRIDAGLLPYFRGEDVTEVLRELFTNVERNDGWTAALGPEYSALTLQCLEAIRGLRRPNLELRTTPDMPDACWDAAIRAVLTGSGQPSFYNEPLYQRALGEAFPHIPELDRLRFCGGGCTETMLAGITNVGSLDAGVNLALIMTDHLRGEGRRADSFDALYEGLLSRIWAEVAAVLDAVNAYRASRAQTRPQPVRTLLMDDCIERERDFNAGGARYMWSVVNVAGLINVIDSLLAIRHLVFDQGRYALVELLDLIEAEDERVRLHLAACPCYGKGCTDVNALSADFSRRTFAAFGQRPAYPCGAFLPASIQFTTYAAAGEGVPATADGRRANHPLCDSIGAIHGKDTEGPTAMMESAAHLAQTMALGTPVLNLRVQKRHGAAALRSLITGYFAQGGMQLQISCISREDILDAMAHPERHENLIVRVGGFSEYFNRLSSELKQTVLHRTEY